MLSGTRTRAASRLVAAGLLAAVLTPIGDGLLEQSAHAQAALQIEGFSVETGDGDQRSPRIDGDWVVWEDYRRSGSDRLADIRARNLQTGQEHRLTDTPNAQHPDISGTFVVWAEEDEYGERDLVVYDVVERGTITRIDEDGDQDYPSISGRKLVWQDNRRGTWDVRGFDIDQNEGFVVERADAHQTRPSIHGNLVAWQDSRDGGRVWYRDLTTNVESRIEELNDAFEPAVHGNLIALRGGGSRSNPEDAGIYLYDTVARSLRLLSSSRDDERANPAISANLVVWWDERDRDPDIWGYDLATGTEFRVNGFSRRSDDEGQDRPAVSGTTVVWVDHRGEDPDIRGAYVRLPQPVSAPQAAPEAAPAAAPEAAPAVAPELTPEATPEGTAPEVAPEGAPEGEESAP